MAQFPRFFIIAVFIFFSVPIYFSLFGLCLGFALGLWRREVMMIALCLIYLAGYGLFISPKDLPESLNDKVILLKGKIISTVEAKNFFSQFTFQSEQCMLQHASCGFQLLINDYQKRHVFQKGDELIAEFKLRKFQNYKNPGSQDYKWLQHVKGFSGKGYLKKVVSHIKKSPSYLYKTRERIKEKINVLFKDRFANALMQSLLIGSRHGLLSEDYELFRLTGTSHLIAISGLHVGLIAAISFYLFAYLWRCSAVLCSYIAAHRVGAFSGIIFSLLYSELSGFSTSTQRAFIMSFVFLSAKLFNKKTSIWHSYFLSMSIVLMLNPYSIFLPGFFLSFFAVFILIWFGEKGFLSVIKLQSYIWILMMPCGLYYFHYYSLQSIPANLIAIPLVSLFILPLGFLLIFISSIFEPIAKQLSHFTQCLIDALASYLKMLTTVDYLGTYFFISSMLVVVICTSLIFYALNKPSIKNFCLATAVIFLLLYPRQEKIADKTVKIYVLDVGQGLAVVVKTKNHTLLYDTGAKYGSGFNLGDAVIAPFLMSKGIYHLDTIILSHEDNDHRGGFDAIIKQFKVDTVYRNGKLGFQNCHKAIPWQWNGIQFRFLSVIDRNYQRQNNLSCVLKIDAGTNSALLTGDIEKKAELDLIKKYGIDLKSTYLLSPHHGSKTSSSQAFIKTISPKQIAISVAKFNPYHLPSTEVIKRYKQNDINVQMTSLDGMIEWDLSAD